MANENLFYVVKKHEGAYHKHLALKELEALQKQVEELKKDKDHHDSLIDCCNQLLDGVDVGIYPKRSILGLRILLNRGQALKK